MKVINVNINNVPSFFNPYVLVIGEFDGIHLGHQKLIDEARNSGLPIYILTFSVSPKVFINRYKEEYILSNIDKENEFSNLGVDTLLILESSKELFSLSKDVFMNQILKKLNPSKLFVGFDFSFGFKGEGTPNDLKKVFDTFVLDKYEIEGKKVSSRDIALFLKDGKIESANKLLGKDFYIDGEVVKGFHEGTNLGFKTANINKKIEQIDVLEGVYLTSTSVDNKLYTSITNYGIHPTVNKLKEPIYETYIFDFDGDIVSKNIKVYFHSFLRKEMKFETKEELKKQIESDIKKRIAFGIKK